LLPHGQVGIALCEQEFPAIARFADRVQQMAPAATHKALDVDLRVGAWHLRGQLPDVTPAGLMGYHLGKVRPRNYVALWVRHLVLNCLAPEGVQQDSRWLGEDKMLVFHPCQDALSSLHELLEWYWHGLRRPLHLFPDSSYAYTQAGCQGHQDPLRVARTTWEGSEHHQGEGQERYYQLAFRDTDPLDSVFVMVADAVFLPLFAQLEEQ
jgi:exodeoxyribonuclease V gamma subunit